MNIKTIKKPWGEEIWFAHNTHYAGKILKINKGHRYSLQFHREKIETQYIHKGTAKVTLGENLKDLKEIILHQGEKIDVLPNLIHRIEAIEDLTIFEVSTPELEDIVKLEDDYGRVGEGNNFKEDEILSKNNITNL